MKMHLPHRPFFVCPASELPLLRLGFRPFYLGVAHCSVCSPCWSGLARCMALHRQAG